VTLPEIACRFSPSLESHPNIAARIRTIPPGRKGRNRRNLKETLEFW
jgi:hypothetical protein